MARVVTGAIVPKLRVSCGASVEISVVAAVPPILPLRLVRVTLPVVLVLIVSVAGVVAVIFPEAVCKLTEFIAVLPRAPLTVMPFVPWLFMLRLVARELMLM